jgi:hypothetical protein
MFLKKAVRVQARSVYFCSGVQAPTGGLLEEFGVGAIPEHRGSNIRKRMCTELRMVGFI